jgi:hypothetical protein
MATKVELKAALPADLSGEPADTMRWIKAMKAYYVLNSTIYSSDDIQIVTTLNKMSKGRGVSFSKMWYCYARRTRTSRGTIRLKGGAHEETLHPCYEVARFLRSQGWRVQDNRSWMMKYARLRRSKVKTKVQSWFLKYLATRNRGTVRNTMESYE